MQPDAGCLAFSETDTYVSRNCFSIVRSIVYAHQPLNSQQTQCAAIDGIADMWPVYLINLTANPERLENSDRQFGRMGIPYSRVEGVNGWALRDDEISRVYDEKANRRRARYPLVRPQIGLYLSHIQVWNSIASGSEDGGFIFEDDFEASSNLVDILHMVSHDHGDWDMAKLFAHNSNPYSLSRRPLGAAHEIVVPYRVPITNVAYAIRRESARRMASMAIPFFRPCDESHKFYWEKNLKVSLVVPPPVRIGDEQATTGTVSATRRAANRRNGAQLIRQAVRNITYQLYYQTSLHYHRLREMLR